MQKEEQSGKQADFQIGNIKLSSKFESGNLQSATMPHENQINLWVGADPSGNYRTWFYFSIQGVPSGATITFTLMNMSNQVKLYKEGHQPVYRTSTGEWRRIKIPMAANAVSKTEEGYQVTFKHLFNDSSVHYFAFSYPWTTAENDNFINSCRESLKQQYFCSYETLCLSFQNRPLKILTLTKPTKGQEPETVVLEGCCEVISFKNKRGIFISARVHPGQIAASYMMNGIIKYLFSGSPEAKLLLENFVFYIVPIINPDGVSEGNYRTDSQGNNLNRFYTSPDPKAQPEIFGIKNFLVTLIRSKRIDFCLDLHAHVNKQGAFIYGNSVAGDLKGQVDVCLFPKILSFHNETFDFDACNFSEKNMCSKDKGDELSKEGASRVAIFKQTGLTRCWTLECNYNSSRISHILPKQTAQSQNNSVSNAVLTSQICPEEKDEVKLLNIEQFEKIGLDICQSILDFYALRKVSRIYGTKLKNMANLKINTAVMALRLIPFRFNTECRKLLSNINSGLQLKDCLEKVGRIISCDVKAIDFEKGQKMRSEQDVMRVKRQNSIRNRNSFRASNSKSTSGSQAHTKVASTKLKLERQSFEQNVKKPPIPQPSKNIRNTKRAIPLLPSLKCIQKK